MSHRLNAIGQCWARHQNNTVPASVSIKLSGTGRLLDIKHMCYEYTTPPPFWPTQTTQTSLPDKEYSCCSHPSFSYRSNAHLLSRSDQWSDCQTGCGKMRACCSFSGYADFTRTHQTDPLLVQCLATAVKPSKPKTNTVWSSKDNTSN